ncbi:CYTH and CHAD domain-containing protein [soil metagenome]
MVPAFDGLPGVFAIEAPVEFTLDATYFDTSDLALAARRLVLRRRRGGDDAGWHLKSPLGAGERQELREPLGNDAADIPERLLRSVRVHARDSELIPVVRLQTRRTAYRLLGASGTVLAEFSDDRVRADRLVGEPHSESWREWEVELVDGDPALLDAVQSMLATAGIQLAGYVSKFARALGDRHPRERPSAPSRPTRRSSAGQILLAYADEQVRVLWEQDPLVREDVPESVHEMRVALRRLRSALATFRVLIDAHSAQRLREELKWVAGVLGAARDLEVLRQRLGDLISAEPPELVLGPVARRIDEQLATSYRDAHLAAMTALSSTRYFRLLDSLDSLLAEVPSTPLWSEPARELVPGLIAREWKRMRTAIEAAERAPAGTPRDLALHEVRKSAKRLRYAAEAATWVHPKPARRLAAAAAEVQTILGEHHDSVVSRGLLRRWAAEADLRGESGFSYGRLDALEQWHAAESDAQFARAWSRFPGPSLKV